MIMRKQKILIVHNYYQVPGGEDTVVANEKYMLEKYGHEVVLYNRNNLELKNMGIFQKLMFPVNTIFNFKTYYDIKRIIKNRHIDIVHVHNTLNLISQSVYYAAIVCKVPVVQTIHNFRLLCPSATFYRDGHICEDCVKKGLMCSIKHKCYRNSKIQTAACVLNMKFHRMTGIYSKINYICLTEFNKKKLLQLNNIKREKVFLKPNFINNSNEIIPANKRKNRIIFVGRLDKLKGVDMLFEAWKQLDNSGIELVVCGTGPLETWCRKFIKNNKIKNIKMQGFIYNNEVFSLIADSKALILPTQWYEGFPVSIVEAFSVGTPVICSSIGNAGTLVKEGINGCKFKCNSIYELIKAVFRLSEYENIYESTIKEYKNKYTMEKNYQKLIDIYNDIQISMYNCIRGGEME